MDVLYGIRRPFVYIYTKVCEFIAWFKPSEPPKKTLMKVLVPNLKVKKRARDQSEMYPAYYENHLRNSWNGSETIYLD